MAERGHIHGGSRRTVVSQNHTANTAQPLAHHVVDRARWNGLMNWHGKELGHAVSVPHVRAQKRRYIHCRHLRFQDFVK